MGRERDLVRHLLLTSVYPLPCFCDTIIYVMTLLEQAITRVRELPEEQQDTVAANLINLIAYKLSEDSVYTTE